MKIKVLPDQVINQISAGEVVERPVSVVRELVDNSVDAGAADITVYIESGGRTLIRVCDDGCGMSRDEALLAFERHATSKISSAQDLGVISSMGFRGEALPSIASVSKVTLKTREQGAESGTEINIAGGVIKSVEACPATPGTDIEIRHLFFNTPARRKFLKEPRTEEIKIKQWLIQSSIARPGVRYRLFSDQKEILNLPRREDALQRARELFKGSTVPVDFERNGIRVTGLIGHPSLAQGDSGSFVMLVNRRLITDRMILRALKDGFDSTLKEREYPVGFISLEMPPQLVDVNVHPQKSEVRFSSAQDVFQAVRIGVLEGVKSFKSPVSAGFRPGAPPAFSASSQSLYQAAGHQGAHQGVHQGVLLSRFESNTALRQEAPPYGDFAARPGLSPAGGEMRRDLPDAEDPVSDDFRFSDLTYIAQIFSCYLLCVKGDGFYVVDMHAAHERCNYNTVREAIRARSVVSQQLLMPQAVTLSEEGLQNCLDRSELFSSAGFEIEPFGEDTLMIRSVPSVLAGGDVQGLVREIAASPDDFSSMGRIEEKIDHIAARIACHASIRSGYAMEKEEVYGLFAALDRAALSSACPHGRPVIVRFSKNDVEKWFGRDR